MRTTEKKLVLGLIACLAALLNLAGTVAGAQGLQSDTILQPQGLKHAGLYALRQLDPGLTGAGVRFGVICRSFTYNDAEPQNDYRPAIEHNCFEDSRLSFYDQAKLPSGISPHSTAICSILFGEDPGASSRDIGQFYYQGAAPQAQAHIYEFQHFLLNNVFSLSPPDVDVITAGIGHEFEKWWTRGMEALVEHYGIIVVAGIGNGAEAGDPVLYPGAGANVIGVGVVDSVNTENLAAGLENFALAYTEHSSTGPTGNGRCKPDIVAPGNCLVAETNLRDGYEPTGNWSSFSTPVVAGTIGLLVQKARQHPALAPAVSPEGGNCVIKAILLNSATKLPYWHKGRLQTDDDHSAPLDYIQGAGMLNAVGAYEHLVAGLNKPGGVSKTGWDLNALDKEQAPENIYEITVAEPADKFITATAAWNRHYRSKYPFERAPEKDSNLRLELWAVDPDDHNNDYLLDYSDSSVDNLEHIHAPADPDYTQYEIVLVFSSIENQKETAVSQPYGLAWNVADKQESNSIFWYDLNADGIVNDLDFIIMLNNSSNSIKSPESYLLGDINPNGAIDVNDLKVLLNQKNLVADWYTE
jgi:hypothetical protein